MFQVQNTKINNLSKFCAQ